MSRHIDAQKDAIVAARRREGWTIQQIAEELGCSKQYVSIRLQRIGRAKVRCGGARLASARDPEGDKLIVEARRTGLTLQEIADLIGVTRQAVCQRLKYIARRANNNRPSRSKSISGYRRDSERHKAAREKVTPERRKEIARMGARARNQLR